MAERDKLILGARAASPAMSAKRETVTASRSLRFSVLRTLRRARAPALPVLTGSFHIGSTFWAKPAALIIRGARFSIDEPISFVHRMALDALEHRNVAEVHGMLEWLIALVAELAFVIGKRAKIDGMFKSASLNILFSRSS